MEREVERNVEMGMLLEFYGALLNDHRRKLMELYVYEDFSLAEIAEQEGISRQGVFDALKRAEQQLVNTEKALRQVEISRSLHKKLDELLGELCATKMEACDKEKLLAILAKAISMIDM